MPNRVSKLTGLKQQKEELAGLKEQMAELSQGVFRPWQESPMGWLFGGGALVALLDFWVRWWTVGH